MSITKTYKKDSSNSFIIYFFIWLAILFGLFYWGKYWQYSPIGKELDISIRSLIMPILDTILNNPIIDYDIIINPKYRVVITPECNGLIPYLMILSAILAFNCNFIKKLIWGILAFFIFFIINIIRLYFVILVVNRYGPKYFYLIHDIVGNILLIITGAVIFLIYIKGCSGIQKS